MFSLRIKLLALLVVLVVPCSAAAAFIHWHIGTETTTSLSGFAGTVESGDTGSLGGQQQGMMGISWAEDSDVPCRLGLYGRDLNDGTNTAHYNNIFNHCSGSAGNWKYLQFDDNVRFFVRGLAVCSSSSNNNPRRLKGIKLFAAKVSGPQEEVEALSTTIVEEHTNCGTWDNAVFCPGGTIAYGIEVHRDGSEITGLALKCRDVDF